MSAYNPVRTPRRICLVLFWLVLTLSTIACGAPAWSQKSVPTPVVTLNLADDLAPDILMNYTSYEIVGATADDLRRQMDQLGPVDALGNRHDAYTEWYVDWSYPNSLENDHCSTGPISVTVAITATFPHWETPPDASPELVDRWTTYTRALKTHEAGHQQIAIEAGREIRQTLKGLPAYLSCSELEQAADAAGQNILDQFREKEKTYDQTTNHGATQGARFP
jgi:predicted secreted Zn-dependent protease